MTKIKKHKPFDLDQIVKLARNTAKHTTFVGALPSIKNPTLIGGSIPIPFDYFIRFYCHCGRVIEFIASTRTQCKHCNQKYKLTFKPEIREIK